jgi:hypothetical protein
MFDENQTPHPEQDETSPIRDQPLEVRPNARISLPQLPEEALTNGLAQSEIPPKDHTPWWDPYMMEVPLWIPEPEFDLPTFTMDVTPDDNGENATRALSKLTQI